MDYFGGAGAFHLEGAQCFAPLAPTDFALFEVLFQGTAFLAEAGALGLVVVQVLGLFGDALVEGLATLGQASAFAVKLLEARGEPLGVSAGALVLVDLLALLGAPIFAFGG